MSESCGKKAKDVKGVVTSFFEAMPVSDYAEAAIDAVVDTEILKDVPVVGTLMGIWEFRNKFKRKGFLKRVETFYQQVSELTLEDLKDFDESFESKEESELFVSDLIELMDRLENEQKALMVGGLFKRLIRSEISKDNFREASRVFERLDNISIFHFMHGYHNHHTYEDSLGDVLVGMRVCKRKIENATRQKALLDPSKVESYIKISFTITPFGRLVLETLHRVYSDKIEKNLLIKEGVEIQPVHSGF